MVEQIAKKLSPKTLETIKTLNTPEKIQSFLDKNIKYNSAREDRTIEEVLTENKAECYNGALFALTCLLFHSYKAGLVEIMPRHNDVEEEHVLCVFEQDGHFGAIAQSKFQWLTYRPPIFLSVHDLAVSYMAVYFTYDGIYLLVSHTDLFDLSPYNFGWIDDKNIINQIVKDLRNAPHLELMRENAGDFKVDSKRFWQVYPTLPVGTPIPDEYADDIPAGFGFVDPKN